MIGNSHAYADSGYTILEQGEINPRTLELDISSFLVTSPGGKTLAEFVTMEEAERFIDEQLDISQA